MGSSAVAMYFLGSGSMYPASPIPLPIPPCPHQCLDSGGQALLLEAAAYQLVPDTKVISPAVGPPLSSEPGVLHIPPLEKRPPRIVDCALPRVGILKMPNPGILESRG
jgi:hypothetical protein